MRLSFTEEAGDRPADDWLAARIKAFAWRTYGITVEVSAARKEQEDRESLAKRGEWPVRAESD